MTDAGSPALARDASSLVLLRDSDQGVDVYMVRRHGRSRFMANAHVFPGGRLDDADCARKLDARCAGLTGQQAARRLGLDDTDLARGLYVAALRETFEEAGVLLARPNLSAADLEGLRRRLNAGEVSFEAALGARGLTLALDDLKYLDHWITPEFEPRRYDARFFVGRAPADQVASHDPVETTAGHWSTVAALLEGNRSRELFLAPPTLVILEGLAGHRTVDEALVDAPDRPMPPTMPRPLLGQEVRELTLMLPGDHCYDDSASTSGPLNRTVLREGAFVHLKE